MKLSKLRNWLECYRVLTSADHQTVLARLQGVVKTLRLAHSIYTLQDY